MKSLTEQLINIYRSKQDLYSGTIWIARHDDVLLHAASGLANRDFGVRNTVDTKFDTASVTKVFTAVAILQLVQKGKLRFQDKITELLALEGTKIPEDVTVQHLLTHTSGIADDADEEAGEDYAALFAHKPNYTIRHCRDFLPQFAYKEPVFKAGTNVRYNNCAFVLLGLVLEKITGMEYREYVAEHVFKPSGMVNTCFQAKDEVCPVTAEGYCAAMDEKGGFAGWKKNIYSFPPVGTADSGAYTTVMDLNRFWKAIQSNTLLTPEYTAMLTQPQCTFTRSHPCGSLHFGFAFEFVKTGSEIVCLYKEGINCGVAAMFSYYPPLDLNVNLLSNQDGALWELNREISGAVMAAMG